MNKNIFSLTHPICIIVRLVLLIALVWYLFFSYPYFPNLRVDNQKEVSKLLDSDRQNVEFNVYTRCSDFRYLEIPSWCRVTDRNKKTFFILTCDANTDVSSRSSQFRVVSGNKSVKITVTQAGMSASIKQAPPVGVAQIQKAAKAGDKEAQYRLGNLYATGREGVETDLKKAFEWYEKAAEQGYPDAQWILGYDVYYAGRYFEAGIPQDYTKAYEWLNKAANQDHIAAQKALGLIYASGQRGVPRDYEKAFEWYQKAAQAGDKSAQKVLSEMYSKGLGVEQDYEKADEWLKIGNQ